MADAPSNTARGSRHIDRRTWVDPLLRVVARDRVDCGRRGDFGGDQASRPARPAARMVSAAAPALRPMSCFAVDEQPVGTNLRARRRPARRTIAHLFRHQMLCRRYRSGRGRRDRECQPPIPARRAVGGIEFVVTREAQKALHVVHRESISDLWTDPENARPEATQNRVLTKVVGNLLIGISNEADEHLL